MARRPVLHPAGSGAGITRGATGAKTWQDLGAFLPVGTRCGPKEKAHPPCADSSRVYALVLPDQLVKSSEFCDFVVMSVSSRRTVTSQERGERPARGIGTGSPGRRGRSGRRGPETAAGARSRSPGGDEIFAGPVAPRGSPVPFASPRGLGRTFPSRWEPTPRRGRRGRRSVGAVVRPAGRGGAAALRVAGQHVRAHQQGVPPRRRRWPRRSPDRRWGAGQRTAESRAEGRERSSLVTWAWLWPPRLSGRAAGGGAVRGHRGTPYLEVPPSVRGRGADASRRARGEGCADRRGAGRPRR